MKAKKAITAILLLFVAAAIGTVAMKGLNPGPPVSATDQDPSNLRKEDGTYKTNISNPLLKPDADVDVVYYFMTTQRCQNCMKIEAYTREAVQNNFKDMLSDNEMLWKMVNVDEPQNRHFIDDYQLFTKSVVFVRYRDGKQVAWKNLEQVWNLLGDKTAFQDYIVNEIESFVRKS